jgi:hypothetical protein
MGIFGFKPKNDEVLDHWISFADGFSLPPQEFYATVKKELDARKIPSKEMSDVEYAEGGLLSDKPLYGPLVGSARRIVLSRKLINQGRK